MWENGASDFFLYSSWFCDELVHVFVAQHISKKENAAGLDEDEFVEVLELTLEEAERYD